MHSQLQGEDLANLFCNAYANLTNSMAIPWQSWNIVWETVSVQDMIYGGRKHRGDGGGGRRPGRGANPNTNPKHLVSEHMKSSG